MFFPPILPSSIPTFAFTSTSVEVPFSMPPLNILGSETQLQYRLFLQDSNISAIPNNTISSPVNIINYISRSKAFIITGINWQQGKLYRLQARFVISGDFSEWSTACYLKATGEITQVISANGNSSTIRIQAPTFMGVYVNSDRTEPALHYQFQLFSATTMLEQSPRIPHNNLKPHQYTFNTLFNNGQVYKIVYIVYTKNNLLAIKENIFNVVIEDISSFTTTFSLENLYDFGAISLSIVFNRNVNETLMVRRSSSRSNYLKWEDYDLLNVNGSSAHFTDLLVESGIGYKYAVQTYNNGERGFLHISPIVKAFYEDTFLIDGEKQIALKYNPQISGYRPVVRISSIETIGSKYPFVMKNGYINYKNFNFSGLLTYYMDNLDAFYSEALKNVGLYSIDENNQYIKTTSLNDNNVAVEREFRELLNGFFTNSNYKLYKSPTEGLVLICVLDYTLEPHLTLGRMLYEFSMKCVEVGESSLSNLLKHGIGYLKVG